MSIKNWYCACHILFFKDKTIQNGSKEILVLSDNLSDLDKLNYDEHSKYQLCSSKIDVSHVYKLFFKGKLVYTVPAW